MCPLRIIVLLLSLLLALFLVTRMLVFQAAGNRDAHVEWLDDGVDGNCDGSESTADGDGAAGRARKRGPGGKLRVQRRPRESVWQVLVSMLTGRFLYRHWRCVAACACGTRTHTRATAGRAAL